MHGYGLATRNIADFEHCLIDLIDRFAFDGYRTHVRHEFFLEST